MFVTDLETEQIQRLIEAIQLMDLTSLVGGETREVIEQLCSRSLNPVDSQLLHRLASNQHLRNGDLTTAAICVYPCCVPYAKEYFDKVGRKVPIATVTGFPSGAEPIAEKLLETEQAVSKGADEIDIVIETSLALNQNWVQLHKELSQAKELCSKLGVHLKVILKVGDLGSLENVYNASMAAMLAGADFIKTSTGKESINATLVYGIVMTSAIQKYHSMTGIKVGFKPAGGIKSATDALEWLTLIKSQLGEDWIYPSLFRFGASSLLANLEKELLHETSS